MRTNQISAISFDQPDAGRLLVRRADLASAIHGEISIRVSSISLNPEETKRALTTSEIGTRSECQEAFSILRLNTS
jgi:hypothetical protein